jgi:hypothetical protein
MDSLTLRVRVVCTWDNATERHSKILNTWNKRSTTSHLNNLCMCARAQRHEGVLEWRSSSTHLASLTGSFTPRERSPGTHWIGGCLGPRAVLDAVVKKKFPAAARTRTPDHSARSPALYHWASPALSTSFKRTIVKQRDRDTSSWICSWRSYIPYRELSLF